MLSVLRQRGITDEHVLAAFQHINRRLFIDTCDPYADCAQSIGHGQTISQPYIVAYMLQELAVKKKDRVLEVGMGSGYVIALLSQLCKTVVGTEIVQGLHSSARKILGELELEGLIPGNYECIHTGNLGAPEQAPYDKILVSAAAPKVLRKLAMQLADGGVMIIPVGTKDQWLIRIERHGNIMTQEHLLPVTFVPLL